MKKCPLCQNDNQCAISKGQQPKTCWCMTASFPQKLLATTSFEDSCICKKCVNDYEKPLPL
ncbi:cysteine-rich CWC family protein [Metabacillus sp. B2-18]|uniref:cysteine-rich CWC family protein n=2 Tax=Bacillaceae TaxID=186817 RepID=UPI001E2F7787|nr:MULTISPECIES: cysteine-rich CWC family protein [Bacillaceae]UGB29377.1 cysteine-rich CWC family protein [Metabacillus sp. B2-18]